MYHFLQAWLSAFPQYNPGTRPNNTVTGPAEVNLFVESYGGLYGPIFALYLEEMNAMRRNGSFPFNKTLEISLASLGIVNGMIDVKTQTGYDPRFAGNNTYGIQAISQLSMYNTITAFEQPGGCSDMVNQCRAGQAMNQFGDNTQIDFICYSALGQCNDIQNTYSTSGLSFYDIRQDFPSPFPSEAYLEYLNSGQVMQSLGVQVNYTESSNAVYYDFGATGDEINYVLSDLATLLSMNVRVALIYGDADYICNWLGGEAVSLQLAQVAPYPYTLNFGVAGYADIVTNETYVGGEVRQYGNLSFARIYNAGHQVPAYQPETAFQVFARVIFGTALATGQPIDASTYRTTGPPNSTYQSSAGASAPNVCWVRAAPDACTAPQLADMQAGKGVVLHGVWYENASQYTPPASTVAAGKPGTPLPSTPAGSATGSASVAPTGVFVATATPSPHKGGAGRTVVGGVWVAGVALAAVVAGW